MFNRKSHTNIYWLNSGTTSFYFFSLSHGYKRMAQKWLIKCDLLALSLEIHCFEFIHFSPPPPPSAQTIRPNKHILVELWYNTKRITLHKWSINSISIGNWIHVTRLIAAPDADQFTTIHLPNWWKQLRRRKFWVCCKQMEKGNSCFIHMRVQMCQRTHTHAPLAVHQIYFGLEIKPYFYRRA